MRHEEVNLAEDWSGEVREVHAFALRHSNWQALGGSGVKLERKAD